MSYENLLQTTSAIFITKKGSKLYSEFRLLLALNRL